MLSGHENSWKLKYVDRTAKKEVICNWEEWRGKQQANIITNMLALWIKTNMQICHILIV